MPFDENLLVRCVGFIQDSDVPMGENTGLRKLLRPMDSTPVGYVGPVSRYALTAMEDNNDALLDFMHYQIRNALSSMGCLLSDSIPQGSKQKVRLLLAVDIDPSAMHWDEPCPTLDEMESLVTNLINTERPIR